MKTLILSASRCSLMFTAVIALPFSVQPVQAHMVTLEQVGSNVVATGSGPINLTGLTLDFHTSSFGGLIQAKFGQITTGPQENFPGVFINVYSGITGPTTFGSGGLFAPNTGSGDLVGIDPVGQISFGTPVLFLRPGYVSGNPLSDSMTFNNATIHSLGLTPGTFTWTWGTGLPNQNFTLVIPAVPDGGSTISLLGCALLGLAALRRKFRAPE